MPHLTDQQLEHIRERYANLPVAVYVPLCSGAFARPCPDGCFNVTAAENLAQEIRATSGDPDAAIVLVYGLPWRPNARGGDDAAPSP